MAAVSVDTICIDADEDEVQICRWDGREIRVERGAALDSTEAVAQGLRRLAPRSGFDLRYRIEAVAPLCEETARRIESAARSAGAGAIRRVPVDIRAEPGLTAARQVASGDSTRRAADRHRLGGIICLELRRRSFLCAAVDGRGRVAGHERGRPADADSACAGVLRVGATAEMLVCYGSASSEPTAVEIARRCGFRRVLIPDYASSLAVVGMLIVDLVFDLRMDAPAKAMGQRAIREGFARLMDVAARRITLEGYDIDDTVCERWVELADQLVIPLEGLTAPRQATEEKAAPARRGGCSPLDAVRGLRLCVTIQTPKFTLPPARGEQAERLIMVSPTRA